MPAALLCPTCKLVQRLEFSRISHAGTWGQLGSNTAFVAANSNPGATQATQTAALSSPATVGNAGLAYMPFGGITSVAFPSKSLGVAVSLGGYISAAGTAKTASIIISIDGVCSWLVRSCAVLSARACSLLIARAKPLLSAGGDERSRVHHLHDLHHRSNPCHAGPDDRVGA